MQKKPSSQERVVQVAAGRVTIEGTLAIPRHVTGVVLFAHGNGSSRRGRGDEHRGRAVTRAHHSSSRLMAPYYRDRTDAGRQLAAELTDYAGRADVIVLALPRGGVPVAFEVASALRAPLDVFIVRKLGVPGHEEYAMGAIATGGVVVVNDDV